MQFQKSSRSVWSMPETITENGITYTKLFQGPKIERKIKDYLYDHPGTKSLTKCPNCDEFSYFYVVVS